MRRTVLALVCALAVVVPTGAAPLAQAAPESHRWGQLSAPDGVLRDGCRSYPYQYRLTPPPGDWQLETFLIDPRGRRLGHHQLLSSYQPERGRRSFRVCRVSTVPGRFLVRGYLTVDNGPDDRHQGWIKPAHFRLRRS